MMTPSTSLSGPICIPQITFSAEAELGVCFEAPFELLEPALELVETLDECAGQREPKIVGSWGR